MKKYTYLAILTPELDGNGLYATFPDLKGCFTCGDTIKDTCNRAKEALEGYLSVLLEDGQKLPTPTHINDIKVNSTDFPLLALIEAEV